MCNARARRVVDGYFIEVRCDEPNEPDGSTHKGDHYDSAFFYSWSRSAKPGSAPAAKLQPKNS